MLEIPPSLQTHFILEEAAPLSCIENQLRLQRVNEKVVADTVKIISVEPLKKGRSEHSSLQQLDRFVPHAIPQTEEKTP